MDADKQNILEFRGYIFKRVKSGLDEKQVTELFDKVLNEKEELIKRQGHLSSLMKLAEKTISEADVMAEQIKLEAEARAKEEAQQLIDSIIAEVTADANKKAESLKQSALEEAQEILLKKAEELQAKLNQSAQELCQRMLGHTEALAQDLTSLKVELEQEASSFLNYTSPNGIKASGEVTPAVTEIQAPTAVAGPSTPAEAVPSTAVDASQIDVATPSVDEKASTTAVIEESVKAEKTPDKSSVEFSNTNEMKFLEVEILPPRDTNEINKIRTFLNKLPGVQAEAPKNFVDKTTMKVTFSREINLTKALSDQSFVQQVYDVEDNGIRKIQVSLNLKSTLDESRESLSRDVRRVLRR
jgi:hypothetical protein